MNACNSDQGMVVSDDDRERESERTVPGSYVFDATSGRFRAVRGTDEQAGPRSARMD
jgi:hypothetical protein